MRESWVDLRLLIYHTIGCLYNYYVCTTVPVSWPGSTRASDKRFDVILAVSPKSNSWTWIDCREHAIYLWRFCIDSRICSNPLMPNDFKQRSSLPWIPWSWFFKCCEVCCANANRNIPILPEIWCYSVAVPCHYCANQIIFEIFYATARYLMASEEVLTSSPVYIEGARILGGSCRTHAPSLNASPSRSA